MTGQSLTNDEAARMSAARSLSDETASADGKPKGSLRNRVFADLVQAEDDTVGLLGYAHYKQNKRDWLVSFFKEHNREATEAEVQAYHLGERVPRRILTYRRLAVDVLSKDPGGREGEGLSSNYVGKGSGASSYRSVRPASFAEAVLARGWSVTLLAVLALIGVVALAILGLSAFSPGILRQILP